jgi:hypothetical protein
MSMRHEFRELTADIGRRPIPERCQVDVLFSHRVDIRVDIGPRKFSNLRRQGRSRPAEPRGTRVGPVP